MRILRVLAAIGFVAEADAQLYVPTPVSKAMTDPAYESMVRSASDDTVQIFAQLPRALLQRGYRCPTNALDCPLQWTMGVNVTYFDWIAQNPQQARDLVTSMKATQTTSTGQKWFDYYPAQNRLLDGLQYGSVASGDVLLVDLGGGNGHDLKCFVERFPEVENETERLVLQELPEVVAAIDRSTLPEIRIIAGSFFDPQPIQGMYVVGREAFPFQC